jgi:hypothetical protein
MVSLQLLSFPGGGEEMVKADRCYILLTYYLL